MRTHCAFVLAPLLVVAMHAHAAGAPTQYFNLVNASHDSVTALAVAPAGSDAYARIELGPPLRGGVTSTTLEIPDGECLRDISVGFADGRTLLYPGIDVCRNGLRLQARDGRSDRLPATRVAAETP